MNSRERIEPPIRFPEFKGHWETKPIEKILERRSTPVDVETGTRYTQIGLRSHGKGIFHKKPVTGESLGNKRVFWIHPDCLVLNIIFAWEQAVGKTTEKESGLIASHRFPMYAPKDQQANIDFIVRFFLRRKGKHLLGLASPGGAGRNRTLGQKEFDKLKVVVPSLPEQRKIADFLTAVDQRIGQLMQKKALLEAYKKGVMQQLFSQAIRFKDDEGKDFPDWEEKKFTDVIKTISPRGFQIESSQIQPNGLFKVIDQGKDRVAGFCDNPAKVLSAVPVIVFGDHTTVLKFIDFEFVVGADGTKILASKDTQNELKYLYYYLIYNNVTQEGYKRHFSILKEISLQIPLLPEQTKIADFLSALDRKIESVSTQIRETQTFKRGLLQQMFV